MNVFDILVIGGGPIGLACGIEAEKAGLSYVIIEKRDACKQPLQLSSKYDFLFNCRKAGDRKCSFHVVKSKAEATRSG